MCCSVLLPVGVEVQEKAYDGHVRQESGAAVAEKRERHSDNRQEPYGHPDIHQHMRGKN